MSISFMCEHDARCRGEGTFKNGEEAKVSIKMGAHQVLEVILCGKSSGSPAKQHQWGASK